MKRWVLWVIGGLCVALFAGCGDDPEPETPKAKEPEQETPKLSQARSGPVENIEGKERIEAAALMPVTLAHERELKIFKAEVRGAFDDQDFEFLEKTAEELRTSKAQFPNGNWKLNQFYVAVAARFHTGDPGYLKDLKVYEAWEKAYPDSITRRVALVDFLVDYAWHARGSGYADSVTEEGRKQMFERLTHAWKILQKLGQEENKDPYSYQTGIAAAMGLGAEPAVFEAIVEESRTHFPEYYPVENYRAYSLLPRWYGKKGDWEKFAIEASEVENGLGDEAYVRILMNLKGYYADIFRDSRAKWPKAKSGLIAMNEKYPDSLYIQNYTAYFAVLGRDREMAMEYFDKLGEEYLPAVWKKPERFVHFRTWARTGEW